jgi:subtilase family serine protease
MVDNYRMRRAVSAVVATLASAWSVPAGAVAVAAALPLPVPAVSDFQLVASGLTPPSESDCFAVTIRCFGAAAIQASYNVGPLYAQHADGHGVTIAIIDSFGDSNIASDLANFNTQMGLPHMCGEPNAACGNGIPTFQHMYWNGNTQVKAPPAKSQGAGTQVRNLWALETALDVEYAHTMAPGANILNITTDPAETLGVQGFPAMMNAEQYVVDHGLATVISQSLGAAEETFSSTQSLLNLRHAFISAANSGVTVLASTGDFGTANPTFTPVKNPATIPYPTVSWPASDPLVTAVGGTYLCTDPATGTSVDSVDFPTKCQANPGVREIGWIDSGGGYSHVFGKPLYQNTLPPGSTAIGSMRGIPDVALEASARTGVLVYDTAPGDASGSNLPCASGDPCNAGWYDVGGTSVSAPNWAGLVAIADQLAGHGLGLINCALYSIASGPDYASDFYDVTTGNNQADPDVPGYPATVGWDPVTGLGTPNAANLVPALAAY